MHWCPSVDKIIKYYYSLNSQCYFVIKVHYLRMINREILELDILRFQDQLNFSIPRGHPNSYTKKNNAFNISLFNEIVLKVHLKHSN